MSSCGDHGRHTGNHPRGGPRPGLRGEPRENQPTRPHRHLRLRRRRVSAKHRVPAGRTARFRNGTRQEVPRRYEALRPGSRALPRGGRGARQEPRLKHPSTRPSSSCCAWGSIPARPTRWCAPSLPSGTGKDAHRGVRPGRVGHRCIEAGADIVGAEDLAEQVEAGNMDFDRDGIPRDDAWWASSAGCWAPGSDAQPEDRNRHARSGQGRG